MSKKRRAPKAPEAKEKTDKIPVVPATGSFRKSLLRVFGCILLALLAAAGWAGYQKFVAVPKLDFKGYNLLFFTLDTTRADHLHCYGYNRVETPNLDSLASEGFLFRRAIAHVPLTLPSHCAIFTSTLPVYNGVRDNGSYILKPSADTLAEMLKEQGYQTGAFVSAFVLDSKWGLNQGFDTYYDHFDAGSLQKGGLASAQRRGEETTKEALQWLDQINPSSPFFLWVHYYDPHDPYEPPEPYASRYSDHPYDGEIAYMDSQVGTVLNALKQRGLLEKTLVLATGDHGEGLGEHQESHHAVFLYESDLHVPLILRIPGVRGRSVTETVQHLDIVPTLLDLLQIGKPARLQGRSLVPLFRHETIGETAVLSESNYAQLHFGWSPLQALTSDKFKYIKAPRAELYNLKEDPSEDTNLFGSMRPMATAMDGRMQDELKNFGPPANEEAAAAQVDRESQEMLRSLGYIGSGPSEAARDKGKLVDPKDKIHLSEMLYLAFNQKRNGRLEKAKDNVDRILAEDPEIVDAQFLKAAIAFDEQNYGKAIEGFQATLKLRPDHIDAIHDLAMSYWRIGEPAKAIQGFEEVLRRDPNYLSALINMGQVLMEQKQPEKASTYYKVAIERLQDSVRKAPNAEAAVSLREQLSGVYFGEGRLDDAERELLEILKVQPKRPSIHYNLAQIYEKRGLTQQAAEAYKEEIALYPSEPRAYNDLAILLRENKLYGLSIQYLVKVVQLQPHNFAAHFMLADSLVQGEGNLQAAREEALKALSINPQFRPASLLLSYIDSKLPRS